jgi:hypothetical protein
VRKLDFVPYSDILRTFRGTKSKRLASSLSLLTLARSAPVGKNPLTGRQMFTVPDCVGSVRCCAVGTVLLGLSSRLFLCSGLATW